MIVKNHIGLIGDFINTIPVMIELSKKEGFLWVDVSTEALHLFDLIPKKYNIFQEILINREDEICEIDLQKAFNLACNKNLHMSQAYFGVVGLDIPKEPIKPELEWTPSLINYEEVDWVISPFSRSLPNDQKLSASDWIKVIKSFPNKRFLLLGNSKFDVDIFKFCDNVIPFFDRPIENVLERMKKSKNGIISVVTGTSHLAYAVSVPNLLLTKQGTGGWGINPEATCIEDFNVNNIIQKMKEHER